ncbi:DUF4184 family protein [Acinetobacter bouvetii]|uniref:DUF4184 family protein n=1 Tax=Acinetobacter bouvetii TaxID=202951 RepID=A0A811GC49_9GAMM|nr:DUF4184 family protein [Acinetobacter bouvetii]CAB1217392.1 hypothetical protein SFB21_2077 [Acinetobacter bouvetii]
MPFTLSHAVLAPPISKLSGNTLPIAALAIGCMIPDLYRLFVQPGRSDPYLAHYWSSLIYPDLLIGLGFSLLWYVLYRPVIYRFTGIQHDLQIYSVGTAFRFFIGICLAVIIGTSTHILWDGLTHADFRTFAFKDFLEQNIPLFGQIYPLHRIVQIATSVLTLPILVWMIWSYYQRYRQHLKISKKVMFAGWGLSLIAVFAGLVTVWDYARYIPSHIWRSDLYSFIGISFNEFTQTALITFSLGCILFLFFDRDRRLG